MAAPTTTLAEMKYQYREVPITDLRSTGLNPRERFDAEKLNELTADIGEHGILEPLIVRSGPDGLEIVAGERRYRAAQAAGLETVPVIIADRSLSDGEALEIAIAENLRRQDLDPIEMAKAYERLADISGRTQKQVAELTGRSQPAVANTIRLLKLPSPVQQMIKAGTLNQWHGLELVRFAEWPAVCEMIASLAAERHAVHTDLKSPLPYAKDLVRAGLAFEVPQDLPFAAALIKDKAAYIKSAPGSSFGYYLNGERFKSLKAEADKDAKEKQETLKAAALGKTPPPATTGKKTNAAAPNRRLPMLEELAPDSYIRLELDSLPEGCTDDCPCRARALLSDGNTHVAICVDKRRYTKLDRVSKRHEEKVLVANHKALDEWLEVYTPTITNMSATEAAVMFGRSIMWLDGAVQRSLLQLGIELPEAGVQSDEFLDWLAGLGIFRLLQIAFVSALRSEINGDGGYRRPMPLTRWYMGQVGATLPEPVVDEDTATDDATDTDEAEALAAAHEAMAETGDGTEAAGEAVDDGWPPADAAEVEPEADPVAV